MLTDTHMRTRMSTQGHEVLIKVRANGCCHSDMFTQSGGYPGLQLPRAPGHGIIRCLPGRFVQQFHGCLCSCLSLP